MKAQAEENRKNAPHESLSILLWFLMMREFDETLKLEKQMMVINFTASASTDNKIHWHSINLKKCNKVVKNHRTRIVNAIQESRWNKAEALQCLLTHIKPVQQKLGLKRLE